MEEGASEKDIADSAFGTWLRYYKGIERYRRLTSGNRNWQTKVYVLWGPSGSGKSRRALSMGGSVDSQYWVSKPRAKFGGVWWDGYEGQSTIVIDEFYGWLSRDLTQRMCDRYPLMVETKGGGCNFLPRLIIFTSNSPPWEWWRVGLGAMQRRLQEPIGRVEYLGNAEFPDEISYCVAQGYAVKEADTPEYKRRRTGTAAVPNFDK